MAWRPLWHKGAQTLVIFLMVMYSTLYSVHLCTLHVQRGLSGPDMYRSFLYTVVQID